MAGVLAAAVKFAAVDDIECDFAAAAAVAVVGAVAVESWCLQL